jgi:hypothetical protein
MAEIFIFFQKNIAVKSKRDASSCITCQSYSVCASSIEMSGADLRGRTNHDQYGTFDKSEVEARDTDKISQKTAFLAAWTTPPNEKWSLAWNFTSTKGLEWFHLYLWMAKDLSWAQDWYIGGLFFGTAAVVMSGYLVFQTFIKKNHVESWHYIGQFFWLLSNYWWMWGEIHDSEYPDEPKIYPDHTRQSSILMGCAFCWVLSYYVVVKPFKLLPAISDEAAAAYEVTDMEPHSFITPIIPTWRQYENLHILFWLGKDAAWMFAWPAMWWPFAALTVALAADFVATTSLHPGQGIHHAHYIAQALWVLSNLLWAFSDITYGEDLDPQPLLSPAGPRRSLRWWAAWLLVAGLAGLAAVHAVWIAAPSRAPARKPKADGPAPAAAGPR